MHPHSIARHWDGSPVSVGHRRRLRVDPTSSSRLLRTGQSGYCRGCDNRVDWHPHADHRPLGLHPGELRTRAVPESTRWHLSSGIAHGHADSAWCRIPHAVLCPRHPAGADLTAPVAELRRLLAVRTRRRVDAGLFTPPSSVEVPADTCRDERFALPVVEILRIRYLAAQPLEEVQCVAQTRRRHRCTGRVLAPAAPPGIWSLAPTNLQQGQLALPAASLAIYDLNGVPYSEQLRWRTQRCIVHSGATAAPDLTMADWRVFDPLLHHAHVRTRLPDPDSDASAG